MICAYTQWSRFTPGVTEVLATWFFGGKILHTYQGVYATNYVMEKV